MNPSRAVILIDHQSATVLPMVAGPAQRHTVHAHHHETRQHASGVRTEHAFFGEVCDALDAFTSVLMTGGHQGLADFRHYVEKHRPATKARISGYEVVDHPTDGALTTLARAFFTRQDRMNGIGGSA